MKKIISILLLAMLVLVLFGCTQTQNAPNTNETQDDTDDQQSGSNDDATVTPPVTQPPQTSGTRLTQEDLLAEGFEADEEYLETEYLPDEPEQ